jgi:hypothetical protein
MNDWAAGFGPEPGPAFLGLQCHSRSRTPEELQELDLKFGYPNGFGPTDTSFAAGCAKTLNIGTEFFDLTELKMGF